MNVQATLKSATSTRAIVYTALIAALYFVLTIAFAPLSFYALQFRVSNILKALAVCNPAFAFGFALGNFFANQASPFGPLDWAIMPIFDVAGALAAYALRRRLPVAIVAQSAIIALGVAIFPLGLGASMYMPLTFCYVFTSTLVIIAGGSLILLPAYRAELRGYGER